MSAPHIPESAPLGRMIMTVPDLRFLPEDWSNARRSITNGATGVRIDPGFRDSREVYPPVEWSKTTTEIYGHAQAYLRRWYPERTAQTASISVLRYTGGGHLGMHNDLTYNPQRRLTTVLYLNDDYQGGEIEFPKQGVKLKPKPGELFIFPAGPGHPHRVHQVTSGHRMCLQSFWTVL